MHSFKGKLFLLNSRITQGCLFLSLLFIIMLAVLVRAAGGRGTKQKGNQIGRLKLSAGNVLYIENPNKTPPKTKKNKQQKLKKTYNCYKTIQ